MGVVTYCSKVLKTSGLKKEKIEQEACCFEMMNLDDNVLIWSTSRNSALMNYESPW